MLLWINKRDYNAYLQLENRLKAVYEQQHQIAEDFQDATSKVSHVDTDMSVLWDKVNHALARLGGRKSKKSVDQDEPNGEPRSVDELNLAIMRGQVTSWPS